MDHLLDIIRQFLSNHPFGSVFAAALSYYLLRKFFYTLVILVFLVFFGAEYLGK